MPTRFSKYILLGGLTVMLWGSLWTNSYACSRCVYGGGEFSIYCMAGFPFGADTCFSTGTSCYTQGGCSYVGPPLPPIGVYGMSDSYIQNYVEECSRLGREYKNDQELIKAISSKQLLAAARPYPALAELLSAILMVNRELPLGLISNGMFVGSDDSIVEYTGEIHILDGVVQLYFEFVQHPQVESIFAVFEPSSMGLASDLGFSVVDVRNQSAAR